MTKLQARSTRSGLLASTLLAGLFIAAPTMAQTVQSAGGTAGAPVQSSSTAPPVATPGATATDSTVKEVVVTGSILRRKLSDTDAPITVLTAQDLDVRGITTMADAIQSLAANGAATLPNSFTANGAFAAGASAASLRGLTTADTLTLIDGMRTADYPLADDGERNFVDLNSIPDIIVDQIQTLKDGASSTYGADAIAGVINIITKKTYEGLTMKAEDGITEDGGGGEDNYQVLFGHGNLQEDGYNFYIGAEYENDQALYNSQRGFPYDTSNLSSLCGTSLGNANSYAGNAPGSLTCRGNGIANGLQYNGGFLGVGSTNVPVVAPYLNGVLNGNYQLLNPAAGCGALTPITLTAANLAAGGGNAVGVAPGTTLCQQDNEKLYNVISPEDTRISVSVRGTKELPGGAEAYFTGTYYRNDVISRGLPQNIQQVASPGPNGLFQNTQFIQLPIYVCPTGIGCNASNGTLNPNNPFAAQGETAQIQYTFGTIPSYSEQLSQAYRFAAGVHGRFNLWGDWNYTVDLTASQTDLTQSYVGYLYGSSLLGAINTGSYNFVNPTMNSKAELNALTPTDVQNATSQLGMIKTTLNREVYQLPGGPMQLGLIGELRYESINDPSANSDINGATDRYLDINATGTIGQRSSQAVAFELDAPVFKQLDIDLAGRYDGYSTGEQGFSPKLGVRFQPIKQITFRSTLSQGFRAPSLTELYALPTTGFVTATAPAGFLAAHNNDGYGQNYNLGITTEGTGGLKAERSDNFTVGFVVEPDSHLSVSVDYYYIRIKDVIEPANDSAAIADYYAGVPLPSGFKVTPAGVDPNFPNALPTIGFLSEGFENASAQVSTGYDFGATAHYRLPFGVNFTSAFDGNYVLRLETLYPGDSQSFAGTIGPYFDVSASGTPKFRANWQNTLSYGPLTVGATINFSQGYDLQAEDYGDTAGVCVTNGATASSINAVYQDGVTPVRCKVAAFWDTDTYTTYKITPHIQLFLNVINVFNTQAPYDPTTYGGYNYNPAWANAGIYGRTFKFGAKAVF